MSENESVASGAKYRRGADAIELPRQSQELQRLGCNSAVFLYLNGTL